MSEKEPRPIDTRRMPGVKGVDLEHSLNYIELDKVGVDFIYSHYTGTRLTYVAGDRPELEETALRAAAGCDDAMAKAAAVAKFVAEEMLWAGYHKEKTGERLPADRNATEEELIRSGFGWCNEQARVFCCLTQVVGVPSRLVFVSNQTKKYGHVVSEACLPQGWMVVDQSFGLCFTMDGRPVRAYDVWHDPRTRERFEPIYKEVCRNLIDDLGHDIRFRMAASENPLDGFTDLGYYNYFAH